MKSVFSLALFFGLSVNAAPTATPTASEKMQTTPPLQEIFIRQPMTDEEIKEQRRAIEAFAKKKEPKGHKARVYIEEVPAGTKFIIFYDKNKK